MVAMEERERRDFLKRSRNVFGRVSELDSRFPIDFGVKYLIDSAYFAQIRIFVNREKNSFFETLDRDFIFHNQRKFDFFDPR